MTSKYNKQKHCLVATELWEWIAGFEKQYMISSPGRVKSIEREVFRKKQGISRFPEKILKQSRNFGYCIIRLSKNGESANRRVHRLVAEAFIPNPENKPCVNHKNGKRHDNRVVNLEWCTISENATHMYRVLKYKKKGVRGDDSHFSKLNEQDIKELYSFIKDGGSIPDFAKSKNVHKTTIWLIVIGKSWKHLGIDFSKIYKRKIYDRRKAK